MKEIRDMNRWQYLWSWKDVGIVFLDEMSWKDRKCETESGLFEIEIMEGLKLSIVAKYKYDHLQWDGGQWKEGG